MIEFWTKRTLQSLFLPGGLIFVATTLLVHAGLISGSPAAVITFFYYASVLAALLLAWRFHSTRTLLCALVMLLGHQGIVELGAGRVPTPGPVYVVPDMVAAFTALDFIVLTFFPERGSERRALAWFLGLFLLELVLVLFVARLEHPESSVLHYSPLRQYHLRLSQPILLLFIVAGSLLLFRLLRLQKTIDAGMLWALVATCLGLEWGGTAKLGTAYFGVAELILAASIIENSYVLAFQDELTGLSSRRAFNDVLLDLKPPYAIAALDIDHFKSINDTYGHDTGDQVLRLVASRLARIRAAGEAFRVGGEEFTIVFRGRTADEITDLLELLRQDIETTSFRIRSGQERRKKSRAPDRRAGAGRRIRRRLGSGSGMLSVTVSIGVAESQPKRSLNEVIEEADKALYEAKQGGRNRVAVAGLPRSRRGLKPEGPARR